MKETFYYKYYFLLLVVLCTWFNTTSAPSVSLRLIFLGVLVIPFFKVANIMIPVMICFTGVAAYGFSCSYMPTELHYYLIIMIVFLLFQSHKLSTTQKPPILLVAFSLYILIIDLFIGGTLVNINYCLLIVVFSFFFVSKDGHEEISYIISFIMVTLILCLYFFTYGQNEAVEISADGRTIWKDPNYIGNVCAMGIVLAYNVLINKLYKKKSIKNLCLFTMCIGIIMTALNASRGAFLSMAVALFVSTVFSKIKKRTKIGITIAFVLSIIAMYNIGLFDLLEERVMGDDGTGNARTLIWASKYNAYSSLPLTMKIFGSGYERGFNLAFPGGYGFHNDYLAWMVDYGIVGLIFMIFLFVYPLKLVWNQKNHRPIIISLILLLMTCCSTLEPLTAGRITYWYYYMTIVLFARWSQQQSLVSPPQKKQQQ